MFASDQAELYTVPDKQRQKKKSKSNYIHQKKPKKKRKFGLFQKIVDTYLCSTLKWCNTVFVISDWFARHGDAQLTRLWRERKRERKKTANQWKMQYFVHICVIHTHLSVCTPLCVKCLVLIVSGQCCSLIMAISILIYKAKQISFGFIVE